MFNCKRLIILYFKCQSKGVNWYFFVNANILPTNPKCQTFSCTTDSLLITADTIYVFFNNS